MHEKAQAVLKELQVILGVAQYMDRASLSLSLHEWYQRQGALVLAHEPLRQKARILLAKAIRNVEDAGKRQTLKDFQRLLGV